MKTLQICLVILICIMQKGMCALIQWPKLLASYENLPSVFSFSSKNLGLKDDDEDQKFYDTDDPPPDCDQEHVNLANKGFFYTNDTDKNLIE